MNYQEKKKIQKKKEEDDKKEERINDINYNKIGNFEENMEKKMKLNMENQTRKNYLIIIIKLKIKKK